MKRIVIGVIIGSLLGGISLFPTTIPLFLTLNDEPLNYSKATEIIFWLLPLIGLIFGGVIGGIIGKKRNTFFTFKNKPLSICVSCVFLFGFLGLEIGFVFSPVTMIGLGNTSTSIDLWIFPILIAVGGTILGSIVGLIALAIYLPLKRYYAYNKYVNE